MRYRLVQPQMVSAVTRVRAVPCSGEGSDAATVEWGPITASVWHPELSTGDRPGKWHKAPRQGHFTLAEHQSKVGQDTLIGTLTASLELHERYQSA